MGDSLSFLLGSSSINTAEAKQIKCKIVAIQFKFTTSEGSKKLRIFFGRVRLILER